MYMHMRITLTVITPKTLQKMMIVDQEYSEDEVTNYVFIAL